jgi:hypothetical protein
METRRRADLAQLVTVANQMIRHLGVDHVGEFESLLMGLQS